MDNFEIGKIVNTVGVKGEIRVFPTTDDVKRFDLLEEITILTAQGETQTWRVKKTRYHRNLVMLMLDGINDMDAAAKLKGSTIVVAREDALPLAEDEYYVPDLIGLKVLADGVEIGSLTDVLVTGANDVYVVKTPAGKEILIPAIKQCILNVDLENSTISVYLLEGLV